MNKKLLGQLLALGVVSAAATTAMAQERPSYNHLGVQYMTQDLDDYNCDQDGLNVYGSMDLNDGVYVRGSLSDVSGDHCGSTTISAGIGYHMLFGADSSIYGALSYERADVDHGKNDNGLIAAVGLRGFITPEVEGHVGVSHHTIGDGNTQLNVGGNYWFNQQFSATADLGLGSDVNTIAIGLRMNY